MQQTGRYVCTASGGSGKVGGWEGNANKQYHIQTDEGPERYFKYQTVSGQYRKERRLSDGTVVGTYGWVDANGLLRLRDYIADDKGYRIVRTKMLSVGTHTPIADAVSAAKKVPAQAGVGVRPVIHHAPPPPATHQSAPVALVQQSPAVTIVHQGEAVPIVQQSPSVTIVHQGEAVPQPPTPDQVHPTASPTTPLPALSLSDYIKSQRLESSTPAPPPVSSTLPPIAAPTDVPQQASTLGYVPPLTYRPFYNPTNSFDYAANKLYESVTGVRYEDADRRPEYDGVAFTHNGFRYYLPTHYHEEENSASDTRAGSFGYVDPFGIRRVIYYNTSPQTGFVHRKNNRYVGFQSTPYDPRY
ncbi:hypothetical protein AAG570_009064 [Ranatra chinensis]|uniref:Cuticle protein 6 n=1 Tax=Ranatra chinensis TaxID=642074 RepID=A0ABD0Z9R5_9HEMI